MQHVVDKNWNEVQIFGGGNRRAVCIDSLYYNEDGTMNRQIPEI